MLASLFLPFCAFVLKLVLFMLVGFDVCAAVVKYSLKPVLLIVVGVLSCWCVLVLLSLLILRLLEGVGVVILLCVSFVLFKSIVLHFVGGCW